jgi:repressor LexA
MNGSAPELTREQKQDRLLGYLRDYTTAHGWAPTIRETANGIGVKSTSTVSHHLSQLEKEGRIRRGKGSRTITILDQDTEATPHEPDTDI